jgi:hypothetical protein
MSSMTPLDTAQALEPLDVDSSESKLRVDRASLELELSADELRTIAEPRASRRAVARAAVSPGDYAGRLPVLAQALAYPAITLVVAALLMGVAVEGFPLSARPGLVTRTAAISRAAPIIPASPASAPLPVRFANPFDASEVFEFPPGTSETEAHDAVADILTKRAQDRRQARRERYAATERTRVPER